MKPFVHMGETGRSFTASLYTYVFAGRRIHWHPGLLAPVQV